MLVDHIVPAAIAPELFWERSNWQTLCHDCDQRFKKPIERRCREPNEVVEAWNALLEKMRNDLVE